MELTVTYIVKEKLRQTKVAWWKDIRVGDTLRISHVVGCTRYAITNISLVSCKTVTAAMLTHFLSCFTLKVADQDEKRRAILRASTQLYDTIRTDDEDEHAFVISLQAEIITTLMKEFGI